MVTVFFTQLRKVIATTLASVMAVASLVVGVGKAYAEDFDVGASGLSSLAAGLQGAGNHRIRFTPASYVNPGNLTLAASSATSLTFERSAPDTSTVKITGRLLRFEGLTNTTVILRGLAFRLNHGPNEALLTGATTGSPNQKLIIDSCFIYADSVNSTFISWLGTRAEIKRSMIVIGKWTSGVRIDFEADTVSLQNNLLNFEGLVGSKTNQAIILERNTVNRTQFNLTTDGTTAYVILNNLYAFAPSANRLPVGLANRYPMRILGDFSGLGSTATGNTRDSSWFGFDYPASSVFTDTTVSNTTQKGIAGKADTTLWNWRIASDTSRGAWSGPASQALPPHNVFPGQTSLSALANLALPLQPIFTFAPASIPRHIPVTLGITTTYPNQLDSLRGLFARDTAYVLGGDTASTFFSLSRLSLPNATSLGQPQLLGRKSTIGSFTLGAPGTEGTTDFAAPLPTSRVLIPVFGAQNTHKGSNVSVTGLRGDTSITFETITRTGRTTPNSALQVSSDTLAQPAWKRIRPLLRGSEPLGLGLTSTAEAGNGGSVTVTVPKGSTTPFNIDSIFAFNGAIWTAADGVGNRYQVRMPTPVLPSGQVSPFTFALFEKLALGRVRDTLRISQGSVISALSATGHQLKIDSSSSPIADRLPTFAGLSKILKPTWPGRKAGDSLYMVLNKATAKHAAFVWITRPGATDTVLALAPFKNETESLTLALNMSDSTKNFFLGRQYSIAANSDQTWTDNTHTVESLLSLTPGELRVDTTLDSEAELSLSSHVGDTLQVLAKRHIVTENLDIKESFDVRVQWAAPKPTLKADSTRALVLRNGNWEAVNLTLLTNQWSLQLSENDRSFALVRVLAKPDTIPTDTGDTTPPPPKLRALTLSPNHQYLSDSGENKSYQVAYTPDSVKAAMAEGKVRFELRPWQNMIFDSTSITYSGGQAVAGSDWANVLTDLAQVDTSGKVTCLKAVKNAASGGTGRVTLALRVVSEVHPEIADTVFVVLLPKDSLERISIRRLDPPEIRSVPNEPQKVSIKVSLDSANQSKLKHILIDRVSLLPTGEIRKETHTVTANSDLQDILLTVTESSATSFTITYVSQDGVETRDSIPLSVPDLDGFKTAVKAQVPSLPGMQRELIGFPFDVRLGEVLPWLETLKLSGAPRPILDSSGKKLPAPELAKYVNTDWVRLDRHAGNKDSLHIADVTLKKGKGYLLSLPLNQKVELPKDVFDSLTVPSLLAPDTLKLIEGWQIIANPKPFALLDGQIELDDSLVSFFCDLVWDTTTNPPEAQWPTAASLLPFRGYAVHAKEATTIVFNPMRALESKSKPKSAASLWVNLHVQTTWGKSGTLLLTDAQQNRAFPSQGIAGDFGARWKGSQGVMLRSALNPGFAEAFQITSPSRGKVRVALSSPSSGFSPEGYFTWSAAMGRLQALSEHAELDVSPGENTFQLMKLSPSQYAAEEKRLRALYPSTFSYRLDARRGMIAAAIPAGAGSANALSLLVFEIQGRKLHQALYRDLQPGWHEWPLPVLGRGGPASHAYLRLQWRDAQGVQTRLQPLGGGRPSLGEGLQP